MTRVTAVVPCYLRADSAERAIRSVLGQNVPPGVDIEVIACIDGPQPDVRERLATISDPRLRIVELPTRRGHAAARHRGVIEASGDWIGFLDDDDLWLPDKVRLQLEAAENAFARGVAAPIVACRVEARLRGGSLIWPDRVPDRGERAGDYLYARRGIRSVKSGHTLVQTSMILAPASLLRDVSFRPGMRRHADPDWLLRADEHSGTEIVFPDTDKPLAVWSLHGGSRVSGTGDWRYSIAWTRRHRGLLSDRAIAGFLTGPAAHRAGQLTRGIDRVRAFAALGCAAMSLGRLRLIDLAALVLFYADAGRFRPTRASTRASGKAD